MGRRKKKGDPILTQMAEGLKEGAERTIGTTVGIFSPDGTSRDYRGETILYFNPIDDPINFIRRPFGTSIREQIRYHLCRAADHVAYVQELCRGREWILSEEDREFLEKAFWALNGMVLHKKE